MKKEIQRSEEQKPLPGLENYVTSGITKKPEDKIITPKNSSEETPRPSWLRNNGGTYVSHMADKY